MSLFHIATIIQVLGLLAFFFLTGCAQHFPIGNDLYIQKIKIESRECNLFNGVKLCSKENV